MFDIGFWELLIIGVIALLVLGPERLPEAVRSTSRTIKGLKAMASNFRSEMEQQLNAQELHDHLKKAEKSDASEWSPEVKESMDKLKKAADSVRKPYDDS